MTRSLGPVIASVTLILMAAPNLFADTVIRIKDKDGKITEIKAAPEAEIEVTQEGKVVANVQPAKQPKELGAKLNPDERAYSIKPSLDGSGGFLLPGERVDVCVSVTPSSGKPFARCILENIEVLAINTPLADPEGANRPAEIVTLRLKVEHVRFMEFCQDVGGRFSLSKRRSDEGKKPPEKPAKP